VAMIIQMPWDHVRPKPRVSAQMACYWRHARQLHISDSSGRH
jgi:hypothetical protein